MANLTLTLDKRAESVLQELSAKEGRDMSEVASRLLTRALRAARPRPTYDTEALKAIAAEFAEEDEALAESASGERADLLAQEDAA